MRILDKPLLKQLSEELASLCSDMLSLEASLFKRSLTLHEAHCRRARNLAHYLALRRHDVRQLRLSLRSLASPLYAVPRVMSSLRCRLYTVC
jgi:hypothetical protein